MRRWLETFGYSICFRLAALRVFHGWPVGWLESAWTAIWYRYYCPYPIQDNWTARACVRGGHCGCDNFALYAAEDTKR
jgi:hypothetical protein